ncbi:hypothetical protein MPLDJ20_240086 [Mesorhizobium plurifarium]|uniref:Uncharacterized protein n=1 Tax=Mesorhizobium plurifarium TaxID=69974 RepID=A0A090F5I7_MESPL|nr:hypothetical protein MPLDJ20_240086 [Mesorhizobium plurifarium]
MGESRHVTSLLLHHALQRMLILSGEIHDLGHFGLGHLECVDAALAHSMIVNMKHDARGGFAVLLEKPFQDVNDELHRSVIVVQDEDPVQAGLLGLGFGARDDSGAATGIVAVSVTLHSHHVHRGSQTDRHVVQPFRILMRVQHVGSRWTILSPSV